MTKTTTLRYEFEQLEPYKDLCVYVGGFADMSGMWEAAEPDVGLARGGWSIGVDDIFIDSNVPGGEPWQLPHDHPLYSLIESQLLGPHYADRICDQMDESAEPDPDYWRD